MRYSTLPRYGRPADIAGSKVGDPRARRLGRTARRLVAPFHQRSHRSEVERSLTGRAELDDQMLRARLDELVRTVDLVVIKIVRSISAGSRPMRSHHRSSTAFLRA